MTDNYQGFCNYSSCLNPETVPIANGSLTPMYETSSVVCALNLNLSSMLHVPKFPINFLSVSAITKAL